VRHGSNFFLFSKLNGRIRLHETAFWLTVRAS
jgi:hypothetical protein